MLPCRRFADVLADACARLGADVGRYSFIAVDFHHLLPAGLPAHSLALRPAHSRRHLYVTSYTEGFSHFVTSMTAPVASGWSVRRVGLSPTGKRRLLTAHANSGHSPMAQIDPGQKFEMYARLGTALHRKCRGPGWVSAGPTEPKFGGAGTAEPSTWTTMLSDFARPHAQKGVAVIMSIVRKVGI